MSRDFKDFKDFEFSDALRILQSTEEFPISFEDACLWSNIDRNVAQGILEAEYTQNLDYIEAYCRKTGKTFMLSIDCFKCLAVMSNESCTTSKNIRQQFKDARDQLSKETNKNQEINHTFVLTPLDLPTLSPQTKNLTIKCQLNPLSNYFHCKIIDLH